MLKKKNVLYTLAIQTYIKVPENMLHKRFKRVPASASFWR